MQRGAPRALELLSISPLVKAGSSVVSKVQKPGMWGDLSLQGGC